MAKHVCEHLDFDVVWNDRTYTKCPRCSEMMRLCRAEETHSDLRAQLDIANAKLDAIDKAERTERERAAKTVGEDATGHGFGWALRKMIGGWSVRRKRWDASNPCLRYDGPRDVLSWDVPGGEDLGELSACHLLATDWIIDPDDSGKDTP